MSDDVIGLWDVVDASRDVQGSAAMSGDGRFRYRLSRWWADGPRMGFVMLNPSTADALTDDPTIRRCVGFARREGLDGIDVVNLFAYRCTRPRHLADVPDPTGGRANEVAWSDVIDTAGVLVAAWGSSFPREFAPRVEAARSLLAGLPNTWALGYTADGEPRHPLYVRGDAPLVPFV